MTTANFLINDDKERKKVQTFCSNEKSKLKTDKGKSRKM